MNSRNPKPLIVVDFIFSSFVIFGEEFLSDDDNDDDDNDDSSDEVLQSGVTGGRGL